MSPALFDASDYITPVVIREWSRYPGTRKQEISRNAEVKRTNGKEKLQFSKKKVQLELRKYRVSRRQSTAANSEYEFFGQSTSSDSSISSDDEVESKKKVDIESTDHEDFDAYCEEIRKMATSLTETDSGFELISFAPSHQTSFFDQIFVNFCMAEITSEFSSTTIDTSEFFRLDAYKNTVEFISRNATVKRSNGKDKLQFSYKKVLLELRKNRSASTSISTPTTDSCDDEDSARSSGFKLPSFEPSHPMIVLDQIFVNFCMAEFTSEFSSTVIDTSEFFRLDAYKKTVEFVNKQKLIRKDEEEQQFPLVSQHLSSQRILELRRNVPEKGEREEKKIHRRDDPTERRSSEEEEGE
ncbi:hypothetical protein PRIPAC_89077, partial [Pristionchus pacificus]|uniref:Uncharacterized protein n=1 Tax=Pristionchus pacificus TaxID=54126 RepID=A0A2A6CVY4_PRIPA